jgi:hypothetical protein
MTVSRNREDASLKIKTVINHCINKEYSTKDIGNALGENLMLLFVCAHMSVDAFSILLKNMKEGYANLKEQHDKLKEQDEIIKPTQENK